MCTERRATAKQLSDLLGALEALPNLQRVLEGLYSASDLIQESAYAFAHEIDGEQIVNLILLADTVEREAKRLEKNHKDKAAT